MDFLIISEIMTRLSWLCYFKALQIGNTSKVVTIDKFNLILVLLFSLAFLKEQVTAKMTIAEILITVGTILMVV